MSSADLPKFHRLHDGRPILTRVRAHAWENRVTFNPACAYVADRGLLDRIIPGLPFSAGIRAHLASLPALCFLLYRAQGERTPAYDHTRSTMGLAVMSPTLELLARHTEPVLRPDHPYENLGVEDGRLTRVGETFFLFYTAYGSSTPANRVRLAVASSRDFVQWTKHGLLDADFNSADNKNAMLFPDLLDGRYVMFHRPMEGSDRMMMHWADAPTVLGPWKTRGRFMDTLPNPAFRESWSGGGAPPLRLPNGQYLILYHIGNRKADGTREYDLGIAIGDAAKPGFLVKRDEPVVRPETAAETTGDADLGVNNVVFTCGAYLHNGDVYVPYAGADSVVLAGMFRGEEIARYAHNGEEEGAAAQRN
jgi:predicted GH43/DUF377 family glycosyl hydrolase